MFENNKGSVTIETAIILPVILLIIMTFLSSTIIYYHQNQKDIISRRNNFNNAERSPCKVIRNSEYILELLNKGKNLINIFNKGGDAS